MNELVSLGVILFFALLAGHLVKYVRVPEVTGYILAGVLVGPSVLGWISHENLTSLEVFSQVALGLILFSLGSVFDAARFLSSGRKVLLITAAESLLAATLVTGGMLLAGQSWQVSFLLGAVSIETAAASTLMVMRECNSRGSLTDALTGVIAINNVFCLLAFSLVAAVIDLNSGGQSRGAYAAVYPLVWQLIGSMALGFIIGVVLSFWSSHVHEQGEVLILMAGAVLLCVGAAQWLGVSPLVASLSVGATMVNLSGKSRRLFDALTHTDPPLYAIFFVIAGADLNLGLLPSLGILGVIYVLGRSIGKFTGTSIAARLVNAEQDVRRLMGLAMFSQAGLAIGLVLVTNERFPDLAPTITTVVLASVAIFELFGPIGARVALVRSGEARPHDSEIPLIV